MEINPLENLGEDNWKLITKKLVAYTRWKVLGRYLPQGKTPEDIAQEAVIKVWEGKRRWDPQKYPDIYEFLKTVVNSEISHLFESKNPKYLEDIRENGEIRDLMPNPEEAFLLQEEYEKAIVFKEELEKSLEKDKDEQALLVLICLEDEITKPQEIAQKTGLSINEVYKAKKRIRRKAFLLRSILLGENEKKG